MSIPGSYLTIEVDGATVAETTDVNMKVMAKALDSTSKDSGLNSECIGRLTRIAMAGSFLMSADGGNWDKLWDSFSGGESVYIYYYRDGINFLSGVGVIKKLTTKGGNSDSLVTGTYGLRFKYETPIEYEGFGLTTEAGLTITTEDGDTLTIDT